MNVLASGQYALRTLLPGLRMAAITMLAVLGCFGTALLIEHVAHLHVDVVILAVVLAVTLSRTTGQPAGHQHRNRLLSIVLLPLVSVAALEVGSLLHDHETLADAVIVLAFSGAVWIRRFGPLATRAGTIATLPFLAALITPAPVPVHDSRWWAAAIALVAAGWVTASQGVAIRVGWQPRSGIAAAPSTIRRTARGGMPASTKMALQLAVALAAGFALGHLAFGRHWTWVVITVYVVCAGNRGRADVLYKSALRVAGATAGTATATVIAGSVPAGSRLAVVAIFCVLAMGIWLRTYNYAWWAMCMTAALALMYGYFGESGDHLLGLRMLAIVLGAALGLASSWLIFPVRSHDVLRRRVADALAALTDVLQALRGQSDTLPASAARFHTAVHLLDQIAPPLLIARRLRRGPHAADAIEAVRRCAAPVRTLVSYARDSPDHLQSAPAARHAGLVLRDLVDIRRAMGGQQRPSRERPHRPVTDHPLHSSLDAIAAALDTVHLAMSLRRPARQQSAG